MPLNQGQEKAVTYATRWWKGATMFLVLDAKAGYGKTYSVNTLLQRLTKCNPILLCPTNEALSQLRDSIEGDYTFKTIHSALGITPTTSAKDLEFKIGKLPALWDDYNLAVIDEYSQIDATILEVLTSIGIKILFLGHKSQHAPVVKNRHKLDKCISPVTLKGWETITLTQPMRCLGKLGEFVDKLEERIEKPMQLIPRDYDVSKKKLLDYIASKEGKAALWEGRAKAVMWRNTGTDRFNEYIRKVLHGDIATKYKYLKGDRIILTNPCTLLPDLERLGQSDILSNLHNKDLDFCFTNTKAVVIACETVKINFNKDFCIPLYKIKVEYLQRNEETNKLIPVIDYFYDIVDNLDRVHLSDHLEHRAWGMKTVKAKGKAYRKGHFIMSCFANIKGFFCATSHRMQGSTIETVLYLHADLMGNGNKVDRAKCTYVSCSRASKELMIYRGLV